MARNGYFANVLSQVFEVQRPRRGRRDGRSIIEQSRALLEAQGETAMLRLAESILSTYAELDETDRRAFFTFLARDMDVDPAAVVTLATAYAEDGTKDRLEALLDAAEPQRQTFFRRLNIAKGATADLVAMRHDLLRGLRETPEFGKIDLDLVHLFTSWFNRGFLVLRRVDWSTPADLLEKIIAYEAVHEINDWNDLRRRTQPADRRCYAYFHPRMPEDPLIFVEIALTRDIPQSIQEVLSDTREPEDIDTLNTAVFYSISNCQPGLQGISFGEALIKRVVADLSEELPGLKTFVTLSPIPGLRHWAEGEGVTPQTPEASAELAAYFLTKVKRSGGAPRDPVARFHLSNGAQVFDVLAGADSSENGQKQAFGTMVNYRYDTGQLENNSDAFANTGRVALSRRVQQMQKQGALHLEKKRMAS